MVHHDLDQREQGHEQPRDLSVRGRLRRHIWLLVFVLLVFGTVISGALSVIPREVALAQRGPVVLVSGRDDHGLLAEPEVALVRAPGATRAVTQVADGTLVRVLDERGEWLRVQSLLHPQAVGWVKITICAIGHCARIAGSRCCCWMQAVSRGCWWCRSRRWINRRRRAG